MFEVQAERHGTILIMRLTGQVLLPDAVAFDRQLTALTSSGNFTQAVIDLSQVGEIDKAGLGVLVSLSTKFRGGGRRLVLLSPAPHVVRILQDAQIEGFFPTFYSEDELKGYFPGIGHHDK